MSIITKKSSAAADLPAGAGRVAGAAAAGRHGAGVCGAAGHGGQAGASGLGRSMCPTASRCGCGRRRRKGPGFGLSPILAAAGAVSGSDVRAERAGRQGGRAAAGRRHRRSRAGLVDLADGRAGEEDGRAGHPRGRVDGPVGGAAPGQGDAAGVAGAGAGFGRGAGGVRRGLQLRVCEHDCVADADDAAADGEQSAGGVRADVRGERQHGPGDAAGAADSRTGAFSTS